ncbi:MAG: hypothetical protein GXP42_06370 [Chloroflexi bacterium]|nr:hypothetical protein [Chloroflexota bacterium]
MTNPSTPDLAVLATEAKALYEKLEALWADEGVEQLEIFLDPDIVSVLAEIKELSLDFVRRVAEMDTGY